MAHLLEHVVFMDNPVRSMLANRGARTNAFTDFHHTVFHSTCPEKELLPSVFDALTEVIGSPRITPSTLQREKAAVLSEMGMVNSVEHRLDRAVLTALHSENLLSSRFPIGQAGMIASWGVDDVREYHISHYRPDNAVLYVVGDVDAAEVSTMIRHKFGPLESRRKVSIKPIAALSQAKRINRHIPSLLHYWSNRTKSTLVAGLSSQELPSDEAETMRPAYVYQHPLLHQVSFHMLAKTPIVPIVSFGDLKQDVLKQIVLQAALVRLTILTREGALCSLVNVAHRDFPREGCAVCSLDIAMETANWRESVSRVVEEIGRIASEGILRLKYSLLLDFKIMNFVCRN